MWQLLLIVNLTASWVTWEMSLCVGRTIPCAGDLGLFKSRRGAGKEHAFVSASWLWLPCDCLKLPYCLPHSDGLYPWIVRWVNCSSLQFLLSGRSVTVTWKDTRIEGEIRGKGRTWMKAWKVKCGAKMVTQQVWRRLGGLTKEFWAI